MASKFVLVPEEIYHGLKSSDSGNINLDFAKHALERTKRKRENVTAKNINYNQELSRYLHLRDEHQNQPAKIEITKGLKALIKKGDESDEDEQIFDLGPERPQPPASQIRRQRRPHHHYHDDEEMPLLPASPPRQAVNRGQKRKANDYYSSWEEGAKRQLIQQYEPASSSKIVNRQRRRKLPPVSWRREEEQIPADIQQEEPFQPAPQQSIPIHPQLNRKRKAQQNLKDVREAKKSLIDLEELRPAPLQQEASLRFKQKTTNKPRVTQPPHSTSSALTTRSNPPRDLLAEAAAAPLPDDDGDDLEFSQQPGTSAQIHPLPPGPPLPSKTKKRKTSKNEEETERKRIRVGSRKRWSSQTDATNQPKRQKNLPDDGHDLELSQPETSAQNQPPPPEPPLPSKTKKRKSSKDEEDTKRKKFRIGSRKRLSSPTVNTNQSKRQKNPVNEVLSEEQRRQFVEDQRLFTIPNSQLTNEQKRRRLQFVFNRNPTKYGVHDDTILNNAGNPITDSSVAQALDYIIERRAGRIPQSYFTNMDGTTSTAKGTQAKNGTRRPSAGIKPKITETQRDETGERQGARRIDTSISNERGQAEIDESVNNRNGNSNQKPTSQTKEMDKSIEKVLERLYNDPKSPAAFAGVDRLWLEAKKELGNKIRKNDVKHYLEGHRTYTLMRPRRINFSRARTTAAGFMTDCQVDLADFQALSRHNSSNRYLMVVIDVLSKRIFVTPLRTKKSEDMVEGFKRVFSTMPMKPHRIFSDKGTEFRNQQLKKLFDEEEVEKYESTHSEKKAALAERAIRQIKNRLYRYIAQTKTLNWVDVIDQIVDGINKSPSRVHGMRPIDVNFKNSQQIWQKMFGEDQHRALFGKHRKRAKFVPGQTVRMSIAKGQFEKGYIPNYGDEILEIDAVKSHMKPMRYKVRDSKGEKFKGFFYPEELAPVRKDAETTYRIERVFRKRKMPDGTTEVLNHAESLEKIIKDGSQTPIRRKRGVIEPTSPPNALVPKSPPNVTHNVTLNVKRPTSPPREELKSSSGPTHSVLKPTPPLPVSNQTTVSQVHQVVATPHVKKSENQTVSSINEAKQREIGPPPKQRNEKSAIEIVTPPQQPIPTSPTRAIVTEKKATTPPRAISLDTIGPPPKQRNEKSLNVKQGQTHLVTELTPESSKRTTITTTTTTTITEPPKETINDLVGRIEEPTERNRAEELLSVLFGDEQWKKLNLHMVKQIIEGVELQYHPNLERFKSVFTHPRIEFISFSPQLGYVLGFENAQHVRNNEIAKYGSDLRGGFASFAVYAKGLTENMIVGNSLSSLLRVVSVVVVESGMTQCTKYLEEHNHFSAVGVLHRLVQGSETFFEDSGAFFCL
ncbi:hypothetical protein niasHT_017211 [Heterodera trifolii]|uniref:Integrase catalytic domain-containing protein n=1 Tax=Heterodera trifolii TaxID=157864 RepID=A0ABD2L381_9BILA